MHTIILFGLLACLLTIATWTDIKSRLIPNRLTFGGIVLAVIVNTYSSGADGISFSLLGALVGMVMFLPIYALGKMGGGDVKLLAMVGAFLGVEGVLWAAAWSAIGGGVLAVFWLLFRTGLRSGLQGAVGTLTLLQLSGREVLNVSEQSPLKSKMPYAMAIAVGTFVALWQLNS